MNPQLLDSLSMDVLVCLEVLLSGEVVVLQSLRFQLQVVNNTKRLGLLWKEGDDDMFIGQPMTLDMFCEWVRQANQGERAVIHEQQRSLRERTDAT